VSISETVGDTYKVTINDEVYSPHRQYGRDIIVTEKHRLIDRYKYNNTDTIKIVIYEVVYAISIATKIDDLG